MTRSALYLLGSPRIERDGAPLEMDTRKALALVAYLAVSKQQQTRDALAALLWPEYGQGAGGAAAHPLGPAARPRGRLARRRPRDRRARRRGRAVGGPRRVPPQARGVPDARPPRVGG